MFGLARAISVINADADMSSRILVCLCFVAVQLPPNLAETFYTNFPTKATWGRHLSSDNYLLRLLRDFDFT